jgi:hypothetical protein
MGRRALAGLMLLALGVASTAFAGDAAPTIRASSYHSPGAGTRLLAFSGSIPVARAGETVTILARECSSVGYRAIAGVQTDARGLWFKDEVWPVANGLYRARWENRFSNSVLLKTVSIRLAVRKVPAKRAWVVTAGTIPSHDMTGRRVVLQRRRGSSWVAMRNSRLRLGNSPFSFVVRFVVPTRGLTLRVLFPAKTTAPCFEAAATRPWRS